MGEEASDVLCPCFEEEGFIIVDDQPFHPTEKETNSISLSVGLILGCAIGLVGVWLTRRAYASLRMEHQLAPAPAVGELELASYSRYTSITSDECAVDASNR